jgi:tetratricopeptide (TPR) repeat protein
MRIQLFIILLLATGLSLFLYTRPKVVVKDSQGANRDQATATQAATVTASGSDESTGHSPSLSEEQTKSLTILKGRFASSSDGGIDILQEIAELFLKGNVIDSAGYYYEKIAIKLPTESHWLRTGDVYFQAYNLALKTKNVEKFAEKTQNAYKKVLAKSPNNLHALTNLGMTYVTSGSPMQAIGMLRQVLEINPNYEPALVNMGVLSLQSNQYDKAANRFRQVIKVNPQNHNAQLGLAYSLIELNQVDEAKTILSDLQNKEIEPTLRQEVERTLQNLK